MRRIGTKITALLLAVTVWAGGIPELSSVKAEETGTSSVQFKAIDYAVADARVTAQQLVVPEGSEVIDTHVPELLAVKEPFGPKVKVHLVGKTGILHTFELDADNPWISKFDDSKYIDEFDAITGNCYKISSADKWTERQKFNDSLVVVINPDTGKSDLLNMTTGEYHSYGYDTIFADWGYYNFGLGNQFLIYKQGDMYGFLDPHGEKLTEAFCKELSSIHELSNGVYYYYDYDPETGEKIRFLSADGSFRGDIAYECRQYDTGWFLQEGDESWIGKYNGTWYYINFKTRERRELTSDNIRIRDSDYRIFLNESTAVYVKGCEDNASGQIEPKTYFVSPKGTIDLNDKLGGSYCSVKKMSVRNYPYNNSGITSYGTGKEEEYAYAEAYRYVKNERNEWIVQYEYQGLIDSEGNKVYGYALPERWDTEILMAGDGYAVIATNKREIPKPEDPEFHETYYDVQFIDLSGKVCYTSPNHRYINENTITDYYVSERYISFYIGGEEKKTVLFNKETGTCKTYDCDSIELYDEWLVDDRQYACVMPNDDNNPYDFKAGCYIVNLDTGQRFEPKMIDGKTTDVYISYINQAEDGRLFIKVSFRWLDDKTLRNGACILDKNLDVALMGGYGTPIKFREDVFITDAGIWDYKGNAIIDAELDYNVVMNNPLFPIKSGRYRHLYDYEGKEFETSYEYDEASEFYGGTAYLTYGASHETEYDYGKYYSPYVKIIDLDGKDLLRGVHHNRYLPGDYYGFNDTMTGRGIFLKTKIAGKDGWIFYDFTKVKPEPDDTAEKEEKEKEKYESLLANAQSLPNFSLSRMKTEFTLPESVPAIGGEKISLDLSFCPITVEKSGNVFRIGIGFDFKNTKGNLFSLEKEKWNTVKKLIDEKKDDDLKKMLSLDEASKAVNVAKQSVKASIYGYGEGVIENNDVKTVQGKLVIKMQYSVSKKWQEIVVCVPVVLTASVKAALTAEEAIIADFAKAEVTGKGSMNFTLPEIKLTAGVGIVEVADVSVFGAVRNILVLDSSPNNDSIHVQDYVEGDMGVSATVLFASYKKVLWPGRKLIVYDSSGGLITSGERASLEKMAGSEENYSIDRSYARDMSSWGDETASAGNANTIHILQKNVFGQAEPQIIRTDDGLKMMVYVSDVPKRDTGSHTAVFYSVYDEAQGGWQEPAMINDDGTADFYPSVAADGKDIYVAWTNAKTNSFTENAFISEVAAQCEISVARYNREKNAFEAADTLTDNDLADVRPSVFAQDGNVYVAWLQNMNNDILELSGTNNICVSVYENGVLNEKPVLCLGCNTPVYSVKGGIVGGRPALAYVADQDGNLNTSDDNRLHAGFLGEDFSDTFLPEQSDVGNISFVSVGGEDALLYSCGNGVMSSADLQTERCLLAPEEMTGTEYRVVRGEEKDLLIGTETSEKGRNLFAYALQNDGISKKINLTSQEDTLSSPNGFFEDGVFYLAFSRTNYAVSEENMEQSTDMCWMKLEEYSDLALENLNLDQDTITPGEQTALSVDVKNLGTRAVQNYEVRVFADGNQVGTASSSAPLEAGGQWTEQVEFLIPEDCKPGAALSCQVVGEETESYLENNGISSSLGYTDLEAEIFGDAKNSKKPVSVFVSNRSSFSTDAEVKIYDTDENGELLKSYTIKDLKPGISKEITISGEEFAKYKKDVLYVTVKASQPEKNLSDNYNFLYVKDLLKESGGSKPPVSKKNQSITGTSRYTKVVGSKPFMLNAKRKTGDGALTYVSSKPSVASVSKNGTVTIKKVGKTVITVKAKETANYYAKTFNVTLNVIAPKKGTTLTDPKTKVKYKVVKQGKTLAYSKPANKKVKKATIPATVTISGVKYSVTGISAKAFAGCSKLKSITIKTTKLTSKTVGSKAFKGIHSKAVIKVPKKKKKAYQKWLKKKGIGKKVKIKTF